MANPIPNPLTAAVVSAGLSFELAQPLLYIASMAQPSTDADTGEAGLFFFGALISKAASFFSVSPANIAARKARFDSGEVTSPLRIVPATASRTGGLPESCWKISVAP